MNTYEKQFGFKHNLLMVALLLAFGSAQADTDAVDKLIKPDSKMLSAGVAAVTGNQDERSIFGQYNGWSSNNAGLLLDFEVIQRNDTTGTWLNAEGRNLGLDNRELSVSRQKQGDWKYSLEYNEQVRHDPRAINTGLQGTGSAQPTVNALATAGTGFNQNLDIKRQSYTLGTEKWINPNILLEASFKSEKKEGARLSGMGAYCSNIIGTDRCATTSGALLMLPESVNATTSQLEVKASFVGKNYILTAGYYGTSITEDQGSRVAAINGNLYSLNNAAFAPGIGANTLGNLLTQPVAQAPDNQSYQLYLSGNYSFNPTVRATFNYAVTHAKQDESFSSMGLTPTVGLPANLNGTVDTTLAQLGITARPMTKLTLLANTRYEEVQDNTPKALYGGTYTNAINSSKKANSKAEASYQFPQDFRGTLGIDYNWVQRSVPAVGSTELTISPNSLTSVREFTDEIVYRAEIRKAMTDALNASLSFLESRREGSHWINLGNTNASYPSTYQVMRDGDVYSATGVFPTNMMDRKRDKVRTMIDWSATDKLSMQFSLETGNDSYSAPTLKGLHSADVASAGVDATYAVSANWKATGYFNYGTQSMDLDHSAGYIARIESTSSSVGLGLIGKLSGKLEVGGDLTYMDDRSHYGLSSGSSVAAGILPDVSYSMLALKLFAKYPLDTNADIRVDLVHQNSSFDEWTWGNAGVPFAYSDNSTVSMQANQNVTYLGVKYVYKFK